MYEFTLEISPSYRRASSAAVKETSMTDLENKAESPPTTKTAASDKEKTEVDLPKTSQTGSQFISLCLWFRQTFLFFSL